MGTRCLFPVCLYCQIPVLLPASVCLTVHCVIAVTTDEKTLETKSEGSDVSPAADQLTEDKHGRRLGFFFKYASKEILGTHLTDKGCCCQN